MVHTDLALIEPLCTFIGPVLPGAIDHSRDDAPTRQDRLASRSYRNIMAFIMRDSFLFKPEARRYTTRSQRIGSSGDWMEIQL